MIIIRKLTLELGRLLRGNFLRVEAHILLVGRFVLAFGPHLGKFAHPAAWHNCWVRKLHEGSFGIPFQGGPFELFSCLMYIFELAIPHNSRQPTN